MMEKLAMGGYGAYVWSCVLLTLAIVVITDWRARLRHKRVYRDIEVRLKALEDRE
ncbi:MAG: heme exporter protein CcmD [Gammaproteobacteria bacterium]|nr:heme exporter protein CcmD [Gammaproteobacteria bacterium]NNF48477.1 heme exporter protein CcmD [Woeseiaceae bacterium]NNL63278.1 heme exporter protein CcmD [Woeseiaceae bacterium]